MRDAPAGRRSAPPCAADRCDGVRSAPRPCRPRSSPRRRSQDIRALPSGPAAAGRARCAPRRAGDHQEAAGVFVEPMHDAGARQRCERRIPAEQGILQRVVADCRRRDARPDRPACRSRAPRLLVAPPRAGSSPAEPRFRGRSVDAMRQADAGAARDLVAGLARKPADLHLPGLDPGLDAGARMLRKQPRERAIQPHSGQFLRDLQLDNPELCAHGALEASGGASGILPRVWNRPIVRNRM